MPKADEVPLFHNWEGIIMTKTIAQLWNGNLEPIRYFGKENPQIKDLEKLIQSNREKLEQNMNETEKEWFEKYSDCIGEYVDKLNEQAFCDGFCLGTKITTEALTSVEKSDLFL